MFFSKKLLKHKQLNHCFFNRVGGASKGIYKSLNCGLGSKDKKNNIRKNLNIVLEKIKSKNKKIYLPKQVHSNKFYFLENKSFKIRIKCDAIITKQRNRADF